jgi:hypothetical protein
MAFEVSMTSLGNEPRLNVVKAMHVFTVLVVRAPMRRNLL